MANTNHRIIDMSEKVHHSEELQQTQITTPQYNFSRMNIGIALIIILCIFGYFIVELELQIATFNTQNHSAIGVPRRRRMGRERPLTPPPQTPSILSLNTFVGCTGEVKKVPSGGPCKDWWNCESQECKENICQ